VHRDLTVKDSEFPLFLKWLQRKIENEDYMKESASDVIIRIIENPQDWQKQWEEYLDETE
tara:strand:+ start:257 stop:436 length:180 start_codon:yes stop_codon:yes gene_type:complete